jgi:pimeloyl-ACP methyl ester carboxylesterase
MDDGLTSYEIGHTAFFASAAEPRVSYCMYVPTHPERRRHLVVVVHGTDRIAQTYRDAFAGFAERVGAILVAPLFPAGLTAPRELESYKLLDTELRSDLILLSIIEEIRARYQVPPEPILLYGFSGGGHFTHRFLYLHPEHVRAAAIGAPGLVTLLGDPRPWWVGTGDVEARFGRTLDPGAIADTDVRIFVGAEDVDPVEIWLEPGDPLWLEGANDAGANRLERAHTLHRCLCEVGVGARLEIIPGTAHDDRPWLEDVQRFFAEVLDEAV